MHSECIWRSTGVCHILLFGLLRSGHHNKAIHWLELLCLSPQAWPSLSSKASCVELWDQRDVTRVRVRVTYCSNRALAHPAAAGPRAERAPLNSGSARIMINSHRAWGMSVMKASIVAFLWGVRVQCQSLTRIMTSPRLSSIASQTGGQILWELRHE